MQKRRVVITGIGAITPLGLDVKTTWDNLIKSKSGIKKITYFDTTSFPVKIAGQLDSSFNPDNYIEPRDVRKMDLFIQYGIAAASEAIEDSGWKPSDDESLNRTGVILGSGIGGLAAIEKTSVSFHSHTSKVSPYFIVSSLINLLSGHISIKYGFRGPNHAVVTACATGAHAIGDAMRIIRYGDADVMVAGGAEAAITPVGISGFTSSKALATSFNDDPKKASRPWDKAHEGFVMGEGAGVVVLEEYEHAKKRGAKIYAELVGYGMAGDAYHITSVHPEGLGAKNAMMACLKDALIDPSAIDYINAHGTSTPQGDPVELKTVQKLFDDNKDLAMSSTKSMTGHLLGAAGSTEAIYSILAIRDQIVPATINLDNPLDDVKINLVANIAQDKKIDYVMTNSFGFGGTNASLILKKI